MKKIISACVLVLTLVFSGCSQNDILNREPDITQIRSICNLATLECYYHNVAKSNKKADSWLKKDRAFWIKYTGVAKIGIDISKVNMEISGENITISIPKAELLDIYVCEDDLSADSYIISEDGLFKNKITAADQTAAINSAQTQMAQSVTSNKSLLCDAQDRAKQLIENYIEQMGEISNIDYQIKWAVET